MQILVTGGGGFLGGRIVEYLTQMGISVRVGKRDIFVDSKSLDSACKDITAVIHLAAMNAQDCAKDPEEALLVNGLNSLRLIKAAERMGVSKFIYFSTSHVYGSPLIGILNEESLPRPQHTYSITHRLAEDYTLEANNRGKLSGVVFRLTNSVGSPVSINSNCWMLVVNDLCRQVVINKKMVLRSDERIERDYIPISSVTNAVFSVLGINGLRGGIYNLSSGETLSLKELTNLIADKSEVVLSYRPEVEFEVFSGKNTMDAEKLIVENDKLKDLGVMIEKDITDEIGKLLLNCELWFKA